MKFLAKKSHLSPALTAAKFVVPAKPAVAIAGCFLLKLKDNNLEITANDLTGLGLCLNIQVEGEENGEIAVSAADFTEAVSNALGDEITVLANGLNMVVSWGEERDSDLPGRSPEDFIKTPDIEPDNYITLKVQALAYLLSKVAFAASKNSDNRPSLTGILFESEESRLVSVGTDSHRLSRVYVQPEAEEPFSFSRSSIVPPRAIQALLQATNAVGDAEASVAMGFSETHLKFQTPSVKVVAKLLEGPYPAWRPVIPKKLPISIKFNTAEMLEVLQSVNVAADKATHNARLTVQDSIVRISAVGSRRIREKISCVYENPGSTEPLHLGVNVSYLIEILKICGSEETEILVNGEHSLCEILPAGGDSELLFLLMLIRLAE